MRAFNNLDSPHRDLRLLVEQIYALERELSAAWGMTRTIEGDSEELDDLYGRMYYYLLEYVPFGPDELMFYEEYVEQHQEKRRNNPDPKERGSSLPWNRQPRIVRGDPNT